MQRIGRGIKLVLIGSTNITDMKTIIDRAASRGYVDHGWLKTAHTFSFADYYNPQRMHFGALRVLNDDTVAPRKGFGMHPHKNMEVISIPLSGYLKHGDSEKNSDVISRGEIQLMSTGKGIYHSEYNDSATQELVLLQIWVIPKKLDTTPKYENHNIKNLLHKDEISLFIAPDAPISILQDAWFSWGDLSKGVSRTYNLKGVHTGVYVFVMEGEVAIGDVTLHKRDGMGIVDVNSFDIRALENAEFLLIEVAQ